jgi:hypothetical protein
MRAHAHPLWDSPTRAWAPPPTSAAVAAAEAQLGFTLPPALLAAWDVCNGGPLRRTAFPPVRATFPPPDGVRVRDLVGLGHRGDLLASPRLIAEWDYPSPCLVLSCEGPRALLLDYRRCGPHGTPAVLYVDTDHEVAGRPAEWTLSLDLGAFLDALLYRPERTEVGLTGGLDEPAVLALLGAVGAEGPPRADHEGGRTWVLPGLAATEPGPARLRLLPHRRADRTRVFPELPAVDWVVETTAAAPDLGPLLARWEAAFTAAGAAPVLLGRRDAARG